VRALALDADRLTTLAGDGDEPTWGGDGGPAVDAQLDRVLSIAASDDGVVYFFEAQDSRSRVRRIDDEGVITTIAGTGETCLDATCNDGNDPLEVQIHVGTQGMSVGHVTTYSGYTGDVIFLGQQNVVRVIVPGVTVFRIAGSNGSSGFSGDGGAATSAEFTDIHDIVPVGEFDEAGFELYIADTGNHRIRMVDDGGDVDTVAGDGTATVSGDGGLATAAGVPGPIGLAVDDDGDVYIAGGSETYSTGAAVRKIDHVSGNISSLAGDGTSGFRGDRGGAVGARLATTRGLALDDHGNIYVLMEAPTGRVRMIVGPL
jgi:hypothetical protein